MITDQNITEVMQAINKGQSVRIKIQEKEIARWKALAENYEAALRSAGLL